MTDNSVGVLVESSPNITISENHITSNEVGINLWESSNNSISRNCVTNSSSDGLYFDSSSDNIISRNQITDNAWNGIHLKYNSNYNRINGNTISNNRLNGVSVEADSNDNEITNNEIVNNEEDGIDLVDSSRNKIRSNNVTDNFTGIYINTGNSTFNVIYHNNFINNMYQATCYALNTTWHNGYPSGGNYWSDYTIVDSLGGPYQNETGGDGIGDTPYIIDEKNKDNYPLVEPWSPPPPIIGDLNNDGIVDISDLFVAGKAFGSYAGHPRWDSAADMNKDNIVNIIDIVLIASARASLHHRHQLLLLLLHQRFLRLEAHQLKVMP